MVLLNLSTCLLAMQKRFMCALGADRRLAMLGFRVAEQEDLLVGTCNVPWGGRTRPTRALALIYGVIIINKVSHANSDVSSGTAGPAGRRPLLIHIYRYRWP